jgi:hypothetical protein
MIMIKKEILLNPIVKRMDGVKEPPITEPISMKDLSMDEANQHLSTLDRQRWVKEHNQTANLYFIKDGYIKKVDPSGWWY